MKAAVKPHIERVVMPDGTVRLLGVAGRWMAGAGGCPRGAE